MFLIRKYYFSLYSSKRHVTYYFFVIVVKFWAIFLCKLYTIIFINVLNELIFLDLIVFLVLICRAFDILIRIRLKYFYILQV